MASIVTVTTARDEPKLISVDDLKAELQITATDTDEYLSGLLDRVSAICEAFCERVFAVETVLEVFDVVACRESLTLQRFPVVSIVTVTELGEALASDDYRIDAATGLLQRRSGGQKSRWPVGEVEVAYSGGCETLPGPVQQAIFELVKLNQAARTRDPSLRSENILEGLYSYQLFSPAELVRGMPSNVAALLDPFVNRIIF